LSLIVDAALTHAVAELEQSRTVINRPRVRSCSPTASPRTSLRHPHLALAADHTKLRVLAERFVNSLAAEVALPASSRARFDHLLLTAHEHPDEQTTRAHRWPTPRAGTGRPE
jgi:hypothetical protein